MKSALWPWKRRPADGRLALAADGEQFAYAVAGADGRLQRCGVEQRGADTPADFARRLKALALPARQASAVLALADGQLLQVDAPAVKPEELKAAARWRIKDLVEDRLDELTIDVMMVGDGRQRANRQVFVAAARNTMLRSVGELTQAAGVELAVVEVTETAQRNLQTAIAQAEGLAERATAALVLHGEQCLLTICARGELFYARRLDWDDPAQATPPRASTALTAATLETVDFIDYGADADPQPGNDGDAPRLVIELQRSFDVWERSWPDLPLAGLWLQLGAGSAAQAVALELALGLRVQVLDAESIFPGLAGLAGSPATAATLLPLLGALLRQETRQP